MFSEASVSHSVQRGWGLPMGGCIRGGGVLPTGGGLPNPPILNLVAVTAVVRTHPTGMHSSCIKLNNITRMHSSRMHTARSSSCPGGVSTRHPPGSRPPGPGTPREQTPPDQALPREQTPPGSRHPPVDRITDACENITLPQLRCGR